jgi:hypothetical protein
MRQERMLGVAMLVAGLAIAGISVTQMRSGGVVHAQVTPPATSAQDDKPAESRPTTIAPEPARPPNTEGTTTGSSPPASGDRPPMTGTPLPSAPAEKTGRPVQPK